MLRPWFGLPAGRPVQVLVADWGAHSLAPAASVTHGRGRGGRGGGAAASQQRLPFSCHSPLASAQEGSVASQAGGGATPGTGQGQGFGCEPPVTVVTGEGTVTALTH